MATAAARAGSIAPHTPSLTSRTSAGRSFLPPGAGADSGVSRSSRQPRWYSSIPPNVAAGVEISRASS